MFRIFICSEESTLAQPRATNPDAGAFRTVARSEEGAIPRPPVAPAAAGPSARPASAGGARVLLVDDDEAVLESTAMLLCGLGCEVRAHAAPAQALAAIESDPGWPDLLLTDSSMPGMKGEELIVRVRAIRPDLPAFLASGSCDGDPAERAARLGIEAFLLKPVRYSELAQLLRDVLETERRRAA